MSDKNSTNIHKDIKSDQKLTYDLISVKIKKLYVNWWNNWGTMKHNLLCLFIISENNF